MHAGVLVVTRYIIAACAAVALSGASYGYVQGLRATRAEDRAEAATRDLMQCRADAATRERIDDAVSDIGRKLPGDISDWLRARAAAAN